MLKGMYGLGKGLLTDTQNTASQVSHQLINSLSHPEAVVQEWQDMRAEATLYRLQGNPTAAARVEAEWQTKFVMSLVPVPVGKAGKLGQVSKTVAEREAIAEAVGGATGRQVPGLPSYYRDGSGVGANVVAPEGYTAVVNLRTGNFEFVAPDGKLYFYSESALVPKEGGNLAGLAAAEREIAAGKAGGGARNSVDTPKGGFGPTYRPADSDQFEKILTSYYGADKTGNRVGNGGLADAVRYEKATGNMLSPAGHEQKAIEVRNRLSDLVCNADNQPPGRYPYSQRDIDFAKQLIKDIDNALGR